MTFDGPYPRHSDSMSRVIYSALAVSEGFENYETISNATPSLVSQEGVIPAKLSLSTQIRSWLRSNAILRRLTPIRSDMDTRSFVLTNSSTISLSSVSVGAGDILRQIPEGNSSISKLVKTLQDMERCFTRPQASLSPPETPFASRSLSMKSGYGSNRSAMEELEAGRFSYRIREKRALQVKERYLEVRDGIWDTLEGEYIPNAWPVGGGKTAIRKERVTRER